LASVALADDFKTVDGKEYKNVTVKRVEPDGIVVSSKSGISKVYFTELPAEIQKKYGYNPQAASAYMADQIAALDQARKQREEASQQKAEETARQSQYQAEQQSARDFVKSQQVTKERTVRHEKKDLPLFEIALVLVCFDHVASSIVNANDGACDRLRNFA
jgi:hypothetical protein